MRTECLNYKYSHDDVLPVSRLLASLGNKLQTCTQRYDRRPYGVGLLIAGYDVSYKMINCYLFSIKLLSKCYYCSKGSRTAYLSDVPFVKLF